MPSQFDKGLEMRKSVLGEEYVEESFARATDFDRPFQEFITENAWGGVWTRGPLDKKTKSLITLSVLVALRAEGEIGLHTRGAINNGVTPDEIVSLLIHASAYAGVPAAVSSIKIVKKTLQDMGELPS
ncbi:MAG: carboxymuconolactone decarboxylase family protein [Chloroflexota bacterium]|jgi:4-carboxymuconolactone decarboxylase|uniref:Carboxymuconolactone decarboxylase-like domain-containing protein n=1 Tax=marine metagenome TaxID=408172 RepID=A0A382GUG2_9ZZZZ|nr:carboxymuconolactone decarboxylase family protein [Chloroflexota bacterium]|tara:strand:- start:1627 stop:2010 length:384 start_codon:yes stop_codon:yes gene_type:complete